METEERTFYGLAFADGIELEERENKNKIELEYYRVDTQKAGSFVKEPKVMYGIEIVKKEYDQADKIVTSETSKIKDIAQNEESVNKMIGILKENKVTPVTLDNVIEDLTQIMP